jgi:hypothetical protein
MVTRYEFHTEDTKILSAKVKNVEATATRRPRFVQPLVYTLFLLEFYVAYFGI